MALAVESSGTQTATIGVLHQLAAPTTAKTRVLRIDLAAMAAGDVLTVRVSTKVLTGGVERIQYSNTYVNVVGAPIVETVPITCMYGAIFAIEQRAGTGRAYPWMVVTLD